MVPFCSHIVPTKSGDCNLCKSCDIIFLICHMITRSNVISPNGCIPFHLFILPIKFDVYVFF